MQKAEQWHWMDRYNILWIKKVKQRIWLFDPLLNQQCFQDLQQSVFNAEMIEEQSLEVNMVHLLHILWNNEIT